MFYLAVPLILVLGVVAVYLWGRGLPQRQQWNRDVLINAPAERVWSVLTDPLRQVEWRSDLKSVEMGAGKPDEARWTEHPRHGWSSSFRVTRWQAGQFFEVERLPNGLFSGCWSARLEQAAQATRVTLVETVLIENPFVRAFVRLWLDLGGANESYQRDLKHCVESQSARSHKVTG